MAAVNSSSLLVSVRGPGDILLPEDRQPGFQVRAGAIMAWDVSTGIDTSDSTPPRLGARVNKLKASVTRQASAPLPSTSKLKTPPAPAICFFASS
jgi:hypothetical protein